MVRNPVPGYNSLYEIDTCGHVFKSNHQMAQHDNGIGYMYVKLADGSKRKTKYIHRLVWETFRGPIPQGYEINHIDHDKKNNQLENLELVTRSENMHKAFLFHGHFGSMQRPKTAGSSFKSRPRNQFVVPPNG